MVWKVNDVQMFLLRSAQHAVASPDLVAANPQVLALPACLDKYIRAFSNGKFLHVSMIVDSMDSFFGGLDYSDEITTLPPDHPMMQPPQLPNGPNGQPLDEAALAELAEQARHLRDADGNLPADANPLLLFLQTLLPWNHVQGARPPARHEDGAE